MDKKNIKDKKNDINQIAETLKNEKFNGPISDVLGSYTGTPVDGDIPVQDADDL